MKILLVTAMALSAFARPAKRYGAPVSVTKDLLIGLTVKQVFDDNRVLHSPAFLRLFAD